MADIVGLRRLSPYEELLGAGYLALHPHVRTAHQAPLVATGTMDVVHGGHPLTPLFVRAMKLPSQGASLPVTLRVAFERRSTGGNDTSPEAVLVWQRQIGKTGLETRQCARHQRLIEKSGAGSVEFVLHADPYGGLRYEHAASRFLRVRLPRAFSPRVNALVSPTPDGWNVDVRVEWRGHLICRYGGTMRVVDERP